MVTDVLRAFGKEEDGITFVEAMLVAPIVIFLLTFMVEMGMALFQINQAAKAVQVGARLAAVSSPIVGDTNYLNLTSDYGTTPAGDPTPSAPLSVVCGAGAAPCQTDRINRILTGGDGSCDPSSGTKVGMCDIAGFINASNVRVTYHRSGLGYVGRPFGPVSTVTIELVNQPFNFLILDKIITMSALTIPAHPVSMTSEDLNSCRAVCP